MALLNLKITGSINTNATCSFDVIGSSITYDENDVIDVPVFSGIGFSGVIKTVKKKLLTPEGFTAKYQWSIKAIGCINMLKREFVDSAAIGSYSDKTAGELMQLVLGSDHYTSTSIDTTSGGILKHEITNGDIKTELNKILNKSGFDWRAERSIKRFEVLMVSYVTNTVVVAQDTSMTGNLSGCKVLVSAGGHTYSHPYENVFEIDYISESTFGEIPSSNIYLTSFDSGQIYAGDEIIILTDHIVYAKPNMIDSDNVVKEFVANRNIYDFTPTYDKSERFNALVVSGTGAGGSRQSSTIYACHAISQTDGSWNNCTYTIDYALDTTFYRTALSTDSTIYVNGHDLNLTTGEHVYIGSNTTYSAISGTPVEKTSDEGDEYSIVTLTQPLDNASTYSFPVGTSLRRMKIYIADKAKITDATSVNIGDESVTIDSLSSDTNGDYIVVKTTSPRVGTNSYAHGVGVLVRDAAATATSPEYDIEGCDDSPLYTDGVLRIKTVTGTTNITTRGALDQLATSMILTGSTYPTTASGTIPLKYFCKLDTRSSPECSSETMLREGDTISVLYDGVTQKYKIKEFTLDMTRRSVSVTLGDEGLNLGSVLDWLGDTLDRYL